MLLDDFNPMGRPRKVSCELIRGNESFETMLENDHDGQLEVIPTGPPPTIKTSTSSVSNPLVPMVPDEMSIKLRSATKKLCGQF